MYPYLGDFPTGASIFVPFHTFNSSGASVTLTGLAVTDIEVYKGSSMTQRASDAGYALVDTDGIDLDGITGIHGFTIDTSDNSDSGFYAAGNEYTVVVSAVTIDSQTVNFIAARFSIERAGGALALAKGANGFSAIKAETAAILADTVVIGAAGAGLTAVPWNAAWDAEVQSEVQDAIEANHLDHLLAQTYDPASKPGAADALLNELIENDGGVSRFSANALEQGPGGSLVLRTATAQAGGASTITLDASASASNDAYRLGTVSITSGTGAGQSRQISAYNGTTKVATVLEPWDIVPDNTSVFIVSPFGVSSVTVAALVAANWAALRSENNVAGSFGEYMNANVTLISGDSAAADNLEAMVDGTGLTLTDVSIPGIEAQLDLIQAQTDQLTFSVAGQVDAHVKRVRDDPITGAPGTAWGRT